MKKILPLIAVVGLVSVLAGCGKKEATVATKPATSPPPPTANNPNQFGDPRSSVPPPNMQGQGPAGQLKPGEVYTPPNNGGPPPPGH